MVNLEKLTGRIISDAEEYARGILDSAKSDIAELDDAARAKIEYIQAESDSRAEKESKAMLDRAAAASESASRAIILSAKTKLLDSAFDAALNRLKQLAINAPADYKNLLVRLLVSVISSAAASETAHGEYYGSGELVAHELYTAAFCARDLEGGSGSVASQVISEASKKLSGTGKKLQAADNAADIDGGFILRSGDVEYNCSFSALMAGYRSEHEGEIYRMLFE